MPWDYPQHATMVLCDSCHELHHDSAGSNRSNIERFDNWEISAASVIKGAIERHFAERKQKVNVR